MELPVDLFVDVVNELFSILFIETVLAESQYSLIVKLLQLFIGESFSFSLIYKVAHLG